MGAFKKGSVVLIRFPFSDLTSQKLRPAVVIAGIGHGDYVLCQITSKPYDSEAIELIEEEFAKGSLQRVSYARPGKLFTANSSILLKEIGELKSGVVHRLVEAVVEVVRG
ncbi:type II toxin-antitoxin system PemK/MazF family toxin [Marinobacter sp. TBZ242]|uniref:Type II toxin-antitoxin system PemK/MazF family toxin n=1 Tax=Marinobacter azerbaijanicus TaxID=3050455 RepID=A0ABT7IAF9_9GAMM|nr:type II toxin-antitoxin system PemK/MazF family toxin [Marinobacter sp. TBZ242]MDL0430139.1 type II toxin-antitoxin system PemK/MazF family toxin [Marinobacter sp. TBZ242]